MNRHIFFTIALLVFCASEFPLCAMDDSEKPNEMSIATDSQPSVWRTFPRRIVNNDLRGQSSESDNDQTEDTKSKKFFVYIANPYAAGFYKKTVNHDLSLRSSGQEGAKTKSARKLCVIMKRALNQFGATQLLNSDCGNNGLVVELSTQDEQSLKAVAVYCQNSEYVTSVSTNKDDLQRQIDIAMYKQTTKLASPRSCCMDELSAQFQAAQLNASLESCSRYVSDDESDSKNFVDSCTHPVGASKDALHRRIDEYLAENSALGSDE